MKHKALYLLIFLAFTSGCGEDETLNSSTATGGQAGTDAGGASSAGSGGSSAGAGAGGSIAGAGGSAGSGGAGVGGAGGTGGSNAGAGGSEPTAPRLFVSATDFATATEVVALTLDGTQTARLELDDPDSVVTVSGGRAFALERTAAVVHPLDVDGAATGSSIDLGTAVASASSQNPHDVVVATGTSPLKAYVPLYDAGHVAVLNLDDNTLTKTIDLTGFGDTLDTDGGVEPDYAWFDSSRNRIWFTLARIDLSTIIAPDYQLACTGRSLLMALDVTDDSIVDLNGSDPGVGLELLHVAPTSVHYVESSDTLYVLSSGCFGNGASARSSLGVNAIKLSDLHQTEALAPAGDAFYSTLLWNPDQVLLQSFAGFTEEGHSWNTTDSTLGAQVSFVPDAATTDGQGTLYGVDTVSDGTNTTFEVVRVDAATGARSVIAQNPFTSGLGYTGSSTFRP
ncbi:MAG: hypothetical protein KC766_06185 [Myxococcales bacterium]|nr:hypothetical protein [Myxococcales bacterium]